MPARPTVWMLLALGLAGCGGEAAAPLTPLEACQRRAEISCAKAYECLEAPERELIGFPASRDACLEPLLAACAGEPEEDFCADGEIYDPAAAGACMAESGAASCQEILEESEDSYAPACAAMCQPGGDGA